MPIEKHRGLDLTTLTGRVAEIAFGRDIAAIFVDETGLGTSVVDRLRQLGVRHVQGVNFGSAAATWDSDGAKPRYADKRAEMWGNLRDWPNASGALPDDPELRANLTGVEYGYTAPGEIQLEKKEDMKKRAPLHPTSATRWRSPLRIRCGPTGDGTRHPGCGSWMRIMTTICFMIFEAAASKLPHSKEVIAVIGLAHLWGDIMTKLTQFQWIVVGLLIVQIGTVSYLILVVDSGLKLVSYSTRSVSDPSYEAVKALWSINDKLVKTNDRLSDVVSNQLGIRPTPTMPLPPITPLPPTRR